MKMFAAVKAWEKTKVQYLVRHNRALLRPPV
jgi:hypothetical protein